MSQRFLLLALLFSLSCTHARVSQGSKTPKNVIIMIVDGMGPEQVKAGRIFFGNEKLAFEKFPYQSTVSTHNIDHKVTDSAAAATAIATGQKVKNRVISPGKTLLEHFKESGKSTGIITNMLLSDATPAAFAAHAKSRRDTKDILRCYLHDTHPNFIGGADESFYRDAVKSASIPYQIVNSASGLRKLQKDIRSGKKVSHVYAGFGRYALIPNSYERKTGLPLAITPNSFFKKQDIPRLSETTQAALDVLSQNKNGFFLVVESGLVDWIGHKNHELKKGKNRPSAIEALAAEMAETHKTAKLLADFAAKHPDTLVILTADHETGGLKINEKETKCLGKKGCLAHDNWTSEFYPDYEEKFAQHTGVNVGVYAMGPGAAAFNAPMDNTQFMEKILGR